MVDWGLNFPLIAAITGCLFLIAGVVGYFLVGFGYAVLGLLSFAFFVKIFFVHRWKANKSWISSFSFLNHGEM